jgi:hypothetical protein
LNKPLSVASSWSCFDSFIEDARSNEREVYLTLVRSFSENGNTKLAREQLTARLFRITDLQAQIFKTEVGYCKFFVRWMHNEG